MKKLMLAFLFIFLNLNLNLNEHTLNLLPAFVGYIFMYQGIKELIYEIPRYAKVQKFVIVMGACTAVEWVLNLLGVSIGIGFAVFASAYSLVFTFISFYISYHIVKGISDVERANSYPLGGEKLEKTWLVLVICNGAGSALALISVLGIYAMALLALVFAIVALVAIICFLVFFNATKNEYYKMKAVMAQNMAMNADMGAKNAENKEETQETIE
jgi:uncharacterized membrane protein